MCSSDLDTHCGETEDDRKICCPQGSRLGKCWWVDLLRDTEELFLVRQKEDLDLEESYYGPNEKKLIKEDYSFDEDEFFDWAKSKVNKEFFDLKGIDNQGLSEILNDGSELMITGETDGLEYNKEIVKVLKKNPTDVNHFLIVFGKTLENGNVHTHCGENIQDERICCPDGPNDPDTDYPLGRCWWINLARDTEEIFLVRSGIEESLIRENQDFGSEDILLQGHKIGRAHV